VEVVQDASVGSAADADASQRLRQRRRRSAKKGPRGDVLDERMVFELEVCLGVACVVVEL
jgi:hypothetical protein